jgi:hypothetical protein
MVSYENLSGLWRKSVIISDMIYSFRAGKSPLIIGVRGFIFEGLP